MEENRSHPFDLGASYNNRRIQVICANFNSWIPLESMSPEVFSYSSAEDTSIPR
jgi:hypothetical protein